MANVKRQTDGRSVVKNILQYTSRSQEMKEKEDLGEEGEEQGVDESHAKANTERRTYRIS